MVLFSVTKLYKTFNTYALYIIIPMPAIQLAFITHTPFSTQIDFISNFYHDEYDDLSSFFKRERKKLLKSFLFLFFPAAFLACNLPLFAL